MTSHTLALTPPTHPICERNGGGGGGGCARRVRWCVRCAMTHHAVDYATSNQGCNLGVTGTTPPCPYLTQHPVVGCTRR
eukprot:scaffold37580_cov54-Attheya_sp.AAC.1